VGAERLTLTRARHWRDLSPRQRTAFLVAASVQFALAATAWTDLAKRPPSLVNGRKAVWAVIIGLNFLGPIAYFARGRRPRHRRR
jgi:hypothetical protein